MAIRERKDVCKLYHVDVLEKEGKFVPIQEHGFIATKHNGSELWEWLEVSVSAQSRYPLAMGVLMMHG